MDTPVDKHYFTWTWFNLIIYFNHRWPLCWAMVYEYKMLRCLLGDYSKGIKTGCPSMPFKLSLGVKQLDFKLREKCMAQIANG